MAETYAELKAEIENWLDNQNPNLIAAIPTFITLAEVGFGRKLHTRDMECRATTPAVPNLVTDETRGVYPLPADWGGHKTVEIVGDNIAMLYWRKLARLADLGEGGTNWLLTKYPDLYLYASLSNAEAWLKNDPRIPLWSSAAAEVMDEIIRHDDQDRFSGGPLRTLTLRNRPWINLRENQGRLQYLPVYDFYDLLDSGITSAQVGEYPGYFTVTESFVKIWPVPSGDPTGDAGWVGCDA